MRCWRPSHPWPLCVDWDRVCNRWTEGRARDGYGWEMSTLLSLPAPPPSRVKEGQSGHQTGPRCPQTGSRQTQHEPRQTQEPIYNGGRRCHAAWHLQLPRAAQEPPRAAKAPPNNYGAIGARHGHYETSMPPEPPPEPIHPPELPELPEPSQEPPEPPPGAREPNWGRIWAQRELSLVT